MINFFCAHFIYISTIIVITYFLCTLLYTYIYLNKYISLSTILLIMPKVSYRKQQIKSITNILDILLKEYSTNTNKITSEILNKEINELFKLLQVIKLNRYLTLHEKTIKSNNFFDICVNQFEYFIYLFILARDVL